MSGRRRPEAWVLAAWAVAALGLAGAIVLGSRPGGALPIWLYRTGTISLGLAAALVAIVGFAVSVLRKPVLQRGRLGGLLCALGTLWAASFPLAYPSSHAGHPSSVQLDLPFAGARTVRFAGARREENLLVLDPARCFGVAFEPAEEEGAGERAVVLAPAPGTLRALKARAVVVEVAAHQFFVLEGLEPVGPELEAGREVSRGSPLGLEGSAGLVLYLTDRPAVGAGEGIPMRLHGLQEEGERGELGGLAPGRVVRSALSAPTEGSRNP